MATPNRTSKLVKQMHDHLVCMDLDTELAGWHLSRTPDYVQRKLADVILAVLRQWAISYGNVPVTHPLHSLYQQSALMIEALNGVPEKGEVSS